MDLNKLWPFELRRGPSKNPSQGACLLDAVSWFEYGCLDDHPPCVSPMLAALGRLLNDMSDDTERQELRRFIPLFPGTVDVKADVDRADYLSHVWIKFHQRWAHIVQPGSQLPGHPRELVWPGYAIDPVDYTHRLTAAAYTLFRVAGRERRAFVHLAPIPAVTFNALVTPSDETTLTYEYTVLGHDIRLTLLKALTVGCAIGRQAPDWDFNRASKAIETFKIARAMA